MSVKLAGAIATAAVFGGAPATAAVTLVRDGQPASVLVVADEPTRAARQAADSLQSWLRKASGAVVPIRAESRVAEGSPETLILVGDTRRTAALGLRSDAFELEELHIRTFPNALALIGDDARPDGEPLSGTVWAVETFAERYLGARRLWPGPLGEVIPRRATLTVDAIDVQQVPRLRQRKIRNVGHNERVQGELDKLGWSADAFRKHHEEAGPWFQFHRIGGSVQGNYGHAYGDYWERFHREHPEWFAMQPDGTRDNSPAQEGHRAQLCLSNRALIEQVARDAIARLRAHPTWDTASLSPNDGSRVTFCLCPSCEAWDAPDGEMIEMWGPNGRIRHVSLTDRHVKFYSAVAEIVTRELPDRSLGAYAYSAYRLPPVHAKLHPNVVIGVVDFGYLNEAERQRARESWLRWSKAARQLFLRPNLLASAYGLPTVYVHRLAEDLRFCAENGMQFTDFDTCYQNWASDGLNYYVLARLLWDLDADVDALVADYCRAGFGPAAEPIREYFAHVEKMTTELAQSNAYQGRRENPEALAERYSNAFLARSRALLDEADRKAGGDETVRQRIAFLRTAVDYARIRRDWTLARAAGRAGDRDAEQRARTLEAEKEAWYQRLGISWTLNVPYLRFYGF
jgi:hypothetical protein